MPPNRDLLEGLDDRQAADVLALGLPLSLSAGEVLFRLGAQATNLYLIESGLVTLTMPMQIGGREEDIRIDERLAGQSVGWSTLIPPHRFALTATASMATDLRVFPRGRLLEHFEKHPDVGYVISRNIAAIVGERLQVFQAMWLRQVQQMVKTVHA